MSTFDTFLCHPWNLFMDIHAYSFELICFVKLTHRIYDGYHEFREYSDSRYINIYTVYRNKNSISDKKYISEISFYMSCTRYELEWHENVIELKYTTLYGETFFFFGRNNLSMEPKPALITILVQTMTTVHVMIWIFNVLKLVMATLSWNVACCMNLGAEHRARWGDPDRPI